MSIVDVRKVNGKRPRYDIYIGRCVAGTEYYKDSKWANPFRVSVYGRDRALELYKEYILEKIKSDPVTYNVNLLKGKRLGCWCTSHCHGEILLKLANES